MKRWILFLLLGIGWLPLSGEPNTLPTPNEEEGFIYFTADQASADPAAKKVNLKGNVHIVQQTADVTFFNWSYTLNSNSAG